MDPNAQNYDAMATEDDLSCIFPRTPEFDPAALDITSPTCAGENSGLIQAEGLVHKVRITTTWIIAGVAANFGNFGQLLAGTYNIIVVDAAQCGDTLSVTVPGVDPVTMTAELTTACHNAADGVITITKCQVEMANTRLVTTPRNCQATWCGKALAPPMATNVLVQSSMATVARDRRKGLGDQPQEMFVSLANTNPVIDATCADIPDGQIYLTARWRHQQRGAI